MSPKININQEEIGMTMYEFEKELIENNKSELFRYDENGKILGIDYYQYMIAATNLIHKIERRNR